MTATAGIPLALPPTLSPDDLHLLDASWRAANYLSVGQIYLLDNPCCASRCSPST